jgi:hypothetical protein
MNLWTTFIGALLILAAAFGPKLGINLYRYDQRGAGRTLDNSKVNRIATAFVGLMLILIGLSSLYTK